MVQLQPGDSPGELAALGLKLKRKKGRQYILQPCPAHRESRCSIYAARPERCRLFECRQLKRVAAGEITEAMALANIHEVKRRVLHLNELLKLEGAANVKQPLSKRCEKVLGEPLVASSDRETVENRNRFTQAMQELYAMLDQDFRPEPKGASGLPGTDFLAPQLANASSRSVTAK
jgi:hypothetical protein